MIEIITLMDVGVVYNSATCNELKKDIQNCLKLFNSLNLKPQIIIDFGKLKSCEQKQNLLNYLKAIRVNIKIVACNLNSKSTLYKELKATGITIATGRNDAFKKIKAG